MREAAGRLYRLGHWHTFSVRCDRRLSRTKHEGHYAGMQRSIQVYHEEKERFARYTAAEESFRQTPF